MPGVPWRALAASLALHAWLLAVFAPTTDSPTPKATPLRANLRPPAPPPPAGPVLPVPPAAAAPRQPPPTPVPAAPVAVPPAPTFETEIAHDKATIAAPPPPAMAGSASVSAAPSAPNASMAADAQADGLRQYRLALASEARRFRRYPDTARRAGWTGTAQIRIVVAAEGGTPRAELEKSSGYAALDAAALDMLRQAARHAALPEALRGRDFAILLPVSFEIEE